MCRDIHYATLSDTDAGDMYRTPMSLLIDALM